MTNPRHHRHTNPKPYFVELVAFKEPTSDRDNQTIGRLIGKFRAASIVFKRSFNNRGYERYAVREDQVGQASELLDQARAEPIK